MLLPVLSLAATLWAAVAPEPTTSSPMSSGVAVAASTYDEATCATLHDENDSWSRAAIGELVPAEPDCAESFAPPPRAPAATLDCEDILPWPGSTIGTCAIPRNTSMPGLRAAPRDTRHAHLDLILNDGTMPLAPPRVAPERAPFHAPTVPTLLAPRAQTLASYFYAPHLSSHIADVPPRPPPA